MVKRELTLLKKKVFNTPQMIMTQDFENIVEYMIDPVRTNFEREDVPKVLTRADFEREDDYRQHKLQELNIDPATMQGLIKIEGTLVNRAGQTQACVELTSYEGIKATFKKQIEMGVKEVILLMDTGGGEAYGVFNTASTLRSLADKHNVKLIAYVDGYACSAGYALASSAHEIIANPQATVGSIGVVVQLMNNSKALENAGYSRTFVYAGDNKIPFDANGEFDEKFITRLQGSINKTYQRFTNLVAINRGMQETDVVKTQASVYDTDEALTLGLIDGVMETDDFFASRNASLQQVNNNHTRMETEEIMTKEQLEALGLDKFDATVDTVVSTAELTALREKADSVEGIQSQLDGSATALATALARVEELEGEIQLAKADAIIASRKASLEEVLGTENDQVASILTATASLSDEAFAVVCTLQKTAIQTKENEMAEVGTTPKADQPRKTLEEIIVAKLTNTQ